MQTLTEIEALEDSPVWADFSLVKVILVVDIWETSGNGGTRRRLTTSHSHYVVFTLCPEKPNEYSVRGIMYKDGIGSPGVNTDEHCASLYSDIPTRKFKGTCWEFALCGSGLVVFGLLRNGGPDWLICNDLSTTYVKTTAGYSANITFDVPKRITWLPNGINAGAQLLVSALYGQTKALVQDIALPFPVPPGEHVMMVVATNGTTIGAVCSFKVNVTDGVPPTLSGCDAVKSMTVPLAPGQNFATYSLPIVHGVDETTFIGSAHLGTSTSVDEYFTDDYTVNPIIPTANFAGAPGGTYSGGPTATLRVGTTQFTWSVKDGAGNGPTTCVYSVTVVDTEPPVLTCPPITIVAQAGMPTGTLATTPVTVTDNLDGTSTKNAPVGTYTVGQHSIVYSTTDAAGNRASCTFILTVNDLQPPTLTCPSSISVNSTASTESVSWVEFVFYADNDPANTVLYQSIPNASYFEVPSVTNVTITVKDKGSYPYAEGNRNSAQCVIPLTIKDIGAPVLACPANVQVSTAAATAIATWAVATITDNDVSPAPTITGSNYASGASFPVKPLGASDPSVSTVTYSGRDASGNVGTCAFTVTVLDSGAPYFSGAAIGGVTPSCPGDLVLSSADWPDTGAANPWWAHPVAVDHKGVVNKPVASQNNPNRPIEQFALGSNAISYMARDAAGNTGFCNFTVTLVDSQIPVIFCPQDMTITSRHLMTSPGQLIFTLDATDDYTTWTNLLWSSPTGNPLPNSSKQVVVNCTEFNIGVNLVKYVARDQAGNAAVECAFKV
eukprot:g7954.t1